MYVTDKLGNLEVFATGVFLRSYEFEPGKWGWIANRFEDDTYEDGEVVDVQITANREAELLLEDSWEIQEDEGDFEQIQAEADRNTAAWLEKHPVKR